MTARPGITAKLFLAILATCVVVIAGMAMATRIGFQQGFLRYVNHLEVQRVEPLRARLEVLYTERGSWNFVGRDRRVWRGLLHDFVARRGQLKHGRPVGPVLKHPQHPRRPDAINLAPRVALLDADRSVIAGFVRKLPGDSVFLPIESGGETVGWLAVAPNQELTDAVDLSFQRQQFHTAWLIGALAIALAGLAAWLTARMFLAPVRRLADATHGLAAGDYATRIGIASGDELGALARDFNRLAETLQKNEVLRRRFTADVAHELRTPLAVLRAEIEAIEDGVREPTDATIASLKAETASLTKLVDDLYDLALSDMGALTYQHVETDVGALLQQATDAFRSRFLGRGIELAFEPAADAVVEGDAARLMQLINNLLENALRYTDAGGRVEVLCVPDDLSVRIDVQDSAPGVPDDALGQVFERLYRVEASRSRAHGGAGLGLSVCRNIVEAHDGTIMAAHSPLGGLKITVTLPRIHR